MSLIRTVDFEGIFTSPNPQNKPYYHRYSVLDLFERNSVVMDCVRRRLMFSEWGSPPANFRTQLEHFKRQAYVDRSNACCLIEELTCEEYNQNGVGVIYPRAKLLIAGPQSQQLLDNFNRVRFVPRLLIDNSSGTHRISRIFTWDAVLSH